MSVAQSQPSAFVARRATPNDLQQMIELGYRLCDQTPYKNIPRDRPAIVRTFTRAMSSQFACAFVTERDGKLTGLIVGIAEQLWFSRARYATDLLFYSEHPGDGRKLLKLFLAWAWKVPGVVEVTMAQSSGMKSVGSLYRREGLQRVGGLFTMVRSK